MFMYVYMYICTYVYRPHTTVQSIRSKKYVCIHVYIYVCLQASYVCTVHMVKKICMYTCVYIRMFTGLIRPYSPYIRSKKSRLMNVVLAKPSVLVCRFSNAVTDLFGFLIEECYAYTHATTCARTCIHGIF
jgi:hypothetical protein